MSTINSKDLDPEAPVLVSKGKVIAVGFSEELRCTYEV